MTESRFIELVLIVRNVLEKQLLLHFIKEITEKSKTKGDMVLGLTTSCKGKWI